MPTITRWDAKSGTAVSSVTITGVATGRIDCFGNNKFVYGATGGQLAIFDFATGQRERVLEFWSGSTDPKPTALALACKHGWGDESLDGKLWITYSETDGILAPRGYLGLYDINAGEFDRKNIYTLGLTEEVRGLLYDGLSLWMWVLDVNSGDKYYRSLDPETMQVNVEYVVSQFANDICFNGHQHVWFTFADIGFKSPSSLGIGFDRQFAHGLTGERGLAYDHVTETYATISN